MAIATQWVATCATVTTSSSSVYTTAAAATSPYLRDLVITNGGAVSVSVSLGGASAATASSFAVPAGGTVILTQCQVPNATTIYAVANSGTQSVSVGYATNVAYI